MTPLVTYDAASSESFNCIAMNRQGSLAAAGGVGKTVCLWDIADKSSPKHLASIAGHSEAILNVKMDPRGRYLATAGLDRQVGLVNLKNHSIQLYKAHNEKVHSVAFSPDGSLLASCGADGLACITKVDPFFENPYRFKHERGICRQVLFSPSGSLLIMAGGLGYSIVDVAKETRISDCGNIKNKYAHSVAMQNDNVLYLANNHNISSYLGSFIKFPSFMAGGMLAIAVGALAPKPDVKVAEAALQGIGEALDFVSDDLPPASSYSTYYQEGEIAIRDIRQNILVGTFGKFPEAFRSEIILDDHTLTHSYLTPQPQVKGCYVHKIAFWDIRSQSLVKTIESKAHASISLPLAMASGCLACAGGSRMTLWELTETPTSASAAAVGSQALREVKHADLTLGKKLYTGLGIKVFQAQLKQETVAVKRCDYKTDEDKKLLLEEARKLALLQHERIVQFKAMVYYPEKSRLAIVMEFLPRSLYDLNNETELAWSDRLQIAQDMVAAVAFLHSRTPPIVHRDIKSLNVMVSEDRRAKLTDFGLSRMVETMSDSLLSSRASTFNWNAPENLEGYYSPASDMWSVAMTLYELASRKIPYHDVAMPLQVGIKIANGDVPIFPANAPKPFVAEAMSCLVKSPDKRSTAKQLMEGLSKIV